MLWIDARGQRYADTHVAELPRLLAAGDVLVVNDAATLPASLRGVFAGVSSPTPIEIRLVTPLAARRWKAVLFGSGDWRTPTEHRPPPPRLRPGDVLAFGAWSATVTAVAASAPRLLEIEFEGDDGAFWSNLYRYGRPIQYAYMREALDVAQVQTAYAARPWAVEMPSAGKPLTWGLLLDLLRAGVDVRSVTHAAGLSSTGDDALDARLPFPERFEVPADTANAIDAAKRRGGRVVAVGTTVVRALEGCANVHAGHVVAGSGTTDWLLDERTRPRVVDGLLTGMHEPATSHYRLLEAFAARSLLDAAYDHAAAVGYLGHEFGDSTLILPAR